MTKTNEARRGRHPDRAPEFVCLAPDISESIKLPARFQPPSRVRPAVCLKPIWTGEHVFAGWLSEAEAALLTDGRRG
jgi:hypothetical protein